MADINTYALGLELQLQSKQAFDILDQLEIRLGEIEKKAASIAPAALNVKEQQQYNQATELGAENVQILDNTLRQLQGNLTATRLAYQGMTDGTSAFTKEQEALREAYEDGFKEQEKILRQFKRMELQGIKLNVQEKEKIKQIHLAIDAYDDLRTASDKFLKAQEKQRKETEDNLSILDKFGNAGRIVKSVLMGINGEAIILGLTTGFLTKSFMSLSAMIDAYATVNYRALGTQADLITVTNELRSSLGATTEESIKTMKALASAGFRATDSIEDLSRANYMFSQSTGVSSDVTAEYQRRVVAMGLSAVQASQGLEVMSNIIRKSGLSAQEAQSMINGLTQSMRALHFFYGKDATLKATKDMAGFIGAVKSAGGDVASVTAQLNEMAKSPIKTRIAFAMVHADIVKGVPQWDDYFSKVAKKMGQLNERAVTMGETLSGEAMIKALKISAEQADSYLLLWERAGKTEAGFKKLIAEGQKGADQQRDFNEAMATFQKSLQRVVEPLLAIGTALLDTVGPAFIALLKPLQLTATALAKVLEFLFKIPVAGTLIKAAFGAMLITPFISKLGSLVKMLGNVKIAAASMGKTFEGVAAIFPTIGKVVGPAFKFLGPTLTKDIGIIKQFGAVSKEAGGGLFGMSSGALSVAGNLAKAHPLITAVVAAVGAALLVVPKIFEMIDSGNEKVQALGIALAALFAPLVVFYVQLRAGWEILKAFWDVFSEVLVDVLQPAIDAFKEMTGTTGQSLGVMKMIGLAMEKVGIIARAVFKFLVPVGKVLAVVFAPWLLIVKALTGSFNPLVGIFKVIGAGAEMVKNMLSSIWSFFKPVIDLVKKSYDMLPKWLKETEKVADATKKAVEIGHKQRDTWTPQHERRAMQAHKAITRVVDKTKELARPELQQAVRPVFSPEARRAEPVASRVNPIPRPMGEADKKLLEAHTKLREAIASMHSTIENTSANQEKLDKIYKVLEQYLPQIAEGGDKGLAGAANIWN